jgi:hypothetical protein
VVGGFSVDVVFHSTSKLLGSSFELIYGPGLKQEDVGKTASLPIQIPVSPPAAAGVYVYAINGQWQEGKMSFFLPIELIAGIQ